MSKEGKVIKNITSSIILNVMNVLMGILGRVVFLRVLDAYLLGISGLFTNILGVLSLADLGLSTAMMYSLYKPIAENDIEMISSLVHYFKKIYLKIAVTVATVGVLCIPFLDYLINTDVTIEHINIYYLLSLGNVVISYLFVYRAILLNADQKQYVANRITLFFKFIIFFTQLFILITTKNYAFYLASAIILTYINNIVINNKTMKLYPYLKNKAKEIDNHTKYTITKNVKALFIYRVAATMIASTDNIFISVILGTITVGYYSNYLLVTQQVRTILDLINNQIKASVGQYIAVNKNKKDKQYEIYKKIDLLFYILVVYACILQLVLFNDFIKLMFGREYVMNYSVVLVIVINFYVTNMQQVIWTFRETVGMFEEIKYITLVTSIINIILTPLMGYYWGLEGIIMATVFSKMLCSWWIEPKKVFEHLKVKPSTYYLNYVYNFSVFILCIFINDILVVKIVYKNILATLIVKGFVSLVATGVIIVLFNFKRKEFKYLLNSWRINERKNTK